MAVMQTARYKRLKERGYTYSDILEITGATRGELDAAQKRLRLSEGCELTRMAYRLLRKPPAWWKASTEEWRRVVRANFADVLEQFNG